MIEDHFLYKGVKVSQVKGCYEYFERLLPKFDTVIELGTYHGGLTLILSDIIEDIGLTTKLITVDNQIYREDVIDRLKKSKVTFLLLDLYSQLTEIIKYIEGRTLVLCDANKAVKFNKIAHYLSPGDYIGVHDYAENEMYWNKISKDTWSYWLCNINDLELEENSLYKAKEYEEFADIVWGLFQKK